MKDPLLILKMLVENIEKQHQLFITGKDLLLNKDQVGFSYDEDKDERTIILLTTNDLISNEPFEEHITENYYKYLNNKYKSALEEVIKYLNNSYPDITLGSVEKWKLSGIYDELTILIKTINNLKDSFEKEILSQVLEVLLQHLCENYNFLPEMKKGILCLQVSSKIDLRYITDIKSSLITHKFINKNTTLAQINRFFGVNPGKKENKIEWFGRADLVYFIKELDKNPNVTWVGGSKWEVADTFFFINGVQTLNNYKFYQRGNPSKQKCELLRKIVHHIS